MRKRWFAATRAGNLKRLRRLLEHGAAVDMTDRWGQTALMVAAFWGSVATVRFLLDAGADPNAACRGDGTAVTYAVKRLQHGGELAATTRLLEVLEAAGGRVELAEAVALNDVERARRLVEADRALPIDACSRHGWDETYLMDAVKLGHHAMVQFLLDRGASVVVQSPDLYLTAVEVAAQRGAVAIAQLLVDHGRDGDRIDWTGWLGQSCLAAADAAGHRPMVQFLLDRGVPLDLAFAVRAGDEGLVRDLLQAGADPDGRLEHASPLEVAVRAGHAGIVALLLEQGARIGSARCRAENALPLAVAAARGDLAIVRLLVAHGASVSELAGDGTTALDRAERAGQPAVAAYLSGFRPDPLEGMGPLTFAAVEHAGRRYAIDPPLVLVPSPRRRSRHVHILVDDTLGIEIEAVDRAELLAELGRRVSWVGVEWSRAHFPPESRAILRRWRARVRPLHLPA